MWVCSGVVYDNLEFLHYFRYRKVSSLMFTMKSNSLSGIMKIEVCSFQALFTFTFDFL